MPTSEVAVELLAGVVAVEAPGRVLPAFLGLGTRVALVDWEVHGP